MNFGHFFEHDKPRQLDRCLTGLLLSPVRRSQDLGPILPGCLRCLRFQTRHREFSSQGDGSCTTQFWLRLWGESFSHIHGGGEAPGKVRISGGVDLHDLKNLA